MGLTDALGEVTPACADRPEVDDLRAMALGRVGDRNGFVAASHAVI
jgi:hypothetical protein